MHEEITAELMDGNAKPSEETQAKRQKIQDEMGESEKSRDEEYHDEEKAEEKVVEEKAKHLSN